MGAETRKDTHEATVSGTPLASWCGNSMVEWLLVDGINIKSTDELLNGLCLRMVGLGIPIRRMFCLLRILHPQVFGEKFIWLRENDGIEKFSDSHDVLEKSLRRECPCIPVVDLNTTVRRRLDIANPVLDFPILEDLVKMGVTDFVSYPLRWSNDQVNIFSIATDRPGGFTSAELTEISGMLPVLGRLIETQSLRRTAVTLLNTYLGSYTGERVLKGLVKRGDGEDISAVIWFCDLRGSTPLADSMARVEFLGILNEFFDCMAGAVLDHGGEVLRYVGDAVLAIFPIEQLPPNKDSDRSQTNTACMEALNAAIDAKKRMVKQNQVRLEQGKQELGFGIALHMGDVTFGNIGVERRLEFTVIGAAANEAARLESMCKTLDQPILISETLARCVPGKWMSLGHFHLRGISSSQEIFAPDYAHYK